MKIREDVLQVQDDLGTSGTKTYDLDYRDIISGLDLRFAATNGATGNNDAPLERCVSEIAIVDGSDVLWSLPGDVARALYEQQAGKPPHEYPTGAQSDAPYTCIPVRFGRELYDPLLALNPTRFRNPQLQVTFDEATVRAAGATGYVTDSFTLSIVAHLMEDAPAPQGFLMAKDVYDFTSLASGDARIDMPNDYPYRMVMVRAYESGVDFRSSITNYELNCDGGRFKPFDSHVRYFVDRMAEIFPPSWRAGYDHASNGDTIQTWIGIDMGQMVVSHESYITGMSSAWPAQFALRLITHAGVAGTERPIHWRVDGWCPHNTLLIPFGRLNEISEWFDARSYESVRLYLTQGNAGAEVNVCVEQYRNY